MEGAVIISDSQGRGHYFAKGIYNYLEGKEKRDFPLSMADIERTEFADGEYKLKITENVRRKACFIIQDPNKESTRWFTDLVFTLEAMRFSSPSEINVVFPYLRFSRQDRKDESRVGVSSKAVADVTSWYADRGMTCDLHAPQIQEYFSIPFDNLYSSLFLIDHLQARHPKFLENLTVVTPDQGGGKRAESLLKRMWGRGIDAEMAIGYKGRGEGGEVEVLKIMGDVKGRNCLLVDDIIDSGTTLIKAKNGLKKAGARAVAAYGTHGFFTKGMSGFKGFHSVMTGDTLCRPNQDVEVVSLTNLFGEAVYRTIMGDSLSGLFRDPEKKN